SPRKSPELMLPLAPTRMKRTTNGPGLAAPRFWTTACVEKLWPQNRVDAEGVTAPAARSGREPSGGGVVPGGTVMLTVCSSTPWLPLGTWGETGLVRLSASGSTHKVNWLPLASSSGGV